MARSVAGGGNPSTRAVRPAQTQPPQPSPASGRESVVEPSPWTRSNLTTADLSPHAPRRQCHDDRYQGFHGKRVGSYRGPVFDHLEDHLRGAIGVIIIGRTF